MSYSKYKKPNANRKFWNKLEAKHVLSTRKKVRNTAHFSSKTMQRREEESDILSVQSNIHQYRILYIQKVTLQMWKKNKYDPGQKLGSTQIKKNSQKKDKEGKQNISHSYWYSR